MVSEAEILGRIRQLEQWRTKIPRSIFRDFAGCCLPRQTLNPLRQHRKHWSYKLEERIMVYRG